MPQANYDLHTWRREREARLGPKLQAMPFYELVGEAYYEVVRDFICPRYVAVTQLLAEKLESLLDLSLENPIYDQLKDIRLEYVWPEAKQPQELVSEIKHTITLLLIDYSTTGIAQRTKEEHDWLVPVLCRLKSESIRALNSIPLLIKEHSSSTGMCSFAHHMRTASTTYPFIMELGVKALPEILTFLRDGRSGMNIILLLQDITQERPYKPDTTSWPGMAGYNVPDTVQAWLEWGVRKGYITSTERKISQKIDQNEPHN